MVSKVSWEFDIQFDGSSKLVEMSGVIKDFNGELRENIRSYA